MSQNKLLPQKLHQIKKSPYVRSAYIRFLYAISKRFQNSSKSPKHQQLPEIGKVSSQVQSLPKTTEQNTLIQNRMKGLTRSQKSLPMGNLPNTKFIVNYKKQYVSEKLSIQQLEPSLLISRLKYPRKHNKTQSTISHKSIQRQGSIRTYESIKNQQDNQRILRNIETIEEKTHLTHVNQQSGKKLIFRRTGKNKLLSENRQKIIDMILGDKKKKNDFNDHT